MWWMVTYLTASGELTVPGSWCLFVPGTHFHLPQEIVAYLLKSEICNYTHGTQFCQIQIYLFELEQKHRRILFFMGLQNFYLHN